MKYGDEIKVIRGIFENNKGIFFKHVEQDKCMIEVFFKVPIEWKPNATDYFKDVIRVKTVSILIKIPLKDIEKMGTTLYQ